MTTAPSRIVGYEAIMAGDSSRATTGLRAIAPPGSSRFRGHAVFASAAVIWRIRFGCPLAGRTVAQARRQTA